MVEMAAGRIHCLLKRHKLTNMLNFNADILFRQLMVLILFGVAYLTYLPEN